MRHVRQGGFVIAGRPVRQDQGREQRSAAGGGASAVAGGDVAGEGLRTVIALARVGYAALLRSDGRQAILALLQLGVRAPDGGSQIALVSGQAATGGPGLGHARADLAELARLIFIGLLELVDRSAGSLELGR